MLGEIRDELNAHPPVFFPRLEEDNPPAPPPPTPSKYAGQGHLVEINLAYVISWTAPDT